MADDPNKDDEKRDEVLKRMLGTKPVVKDSATKSNAEKKGDDGRSPRRRPAGKKVTSSPA